MAEIGESGTQPIAVFSASAIRRIIDTTDL